MQRRNHKGSKKDFALDNHDATGQNLQNAFKVVFKGKFAILNTLIRNEAS